VTEPTHREFEGGFYCREAEDTFDLARAERNHGNCPYCGENVVQSRSERSREERIAARRDRLEDTLWEDRPEDDLLEYAAKLEISLYQYCRMMVQMRGTRDELAVLEQANREGRLLEFAMGEYE
jgi:uncharacterized Zn finger protein (UPF0148 family)